MLGALLAGAWFLGGDSALVPASLPGIAGNGDSSPLESGVLSISAQSAGDTVVVGSVSVSSPGVWVAVRETSGSDLGNVLGAARVGGPRGEVPISLLRATEPGRRYAVQLYRDDNSGAFDPATNSVYVDFDTGARVVVYFTTTE